MRRVSMVALALAPALLAGCSGDGRPTARAAPAPSTSLPLESPGSTTGSRLDCQGDRMAIGSAGLRVPPTPDELVERSLESPTQIARRWFNRQVRYAPWSSAGPFTIEQVHARTKSGQRKIRVDYRAADGRILGTLGVLWEPRAGWVPGAWRSCASAESDQEPRTVTAPGVVIYRAMFSPRAQASRLDCPGNLVGSTGSGRRSGPPAASLTVEQLADKWEADQSTRSNPGWDEVAPPRRWYYYPRDPAVAERAAVDWVDAHGRVVLALGLDRWEDSSAWEVGGMSSCVHGSPR